MREIEVTIDGEELAYLRTALETGEGRKGTLWTKEIDIGDDRVIELHLMGGGPGGEPYPDVTLSEMTDKGLVSLYMNDAEESVFGDFVFPNEGFVLKVIDGASPTPSP